MTVANSLCRLKTLFCRDQGEKNLVLWGIRCLVLWQANTRPSTSGEEAVRVVGAKKRGVEEGGRRRYESFIGLLFPLHCAYVQYVEREGWRGGREEEHLSSLGKKGKEFH